MILSKNFYKFRNINLRLLSYIQGQRSELNIREYFYYIDHQGMLFLDDTKIKNFTSCFKDKVFLEFFFNRIKINSTGNYQEQFPYISFCGKERNYIRCDDRPIVFLQLKDINGKFFLTYAFPDSKLSVEFRPEDLFMHPISMRVYHPCSTSTSGIGLIKSSLAMDISNNFRWDQGKSENDLPSTFIWKGQPFTLNHSLLKTFTQEPESLKGMHFKEIKQ